MNRLLNIGIWLILATAFGLIGLFGYWWTYPYKIIEFEETPFPVLNENRAVKQGDVLIYEVEYCKYINIGAETTRSFNDGILYTLPVMQSNREVGCHDNKVYLEVPKTLPPAKYSLQVLYRFQINPIRKIDIIQYTEAFAVVK